MLSLSLSLIFHFPLYNDTFLSHSLLLLTSLSHFIHFPLYPVSPSLPNSISHLLSSLLPSLYLPLLFFLSLSHPLVFIIWFYSPVLSLSLNPSPFYLSYLACWYKTLTYWFLSLQPQPRPPPHHIISFFILYNIHTTIFVSNGISLYLSPVFVLLYLFAFSLSLFLFFSFCVLYHCISGHTGCKFWIKLRGLISLVS